MTLADYSQRVVLDGSEYLLRLFWNQREAKWYLSLYDSAENPVVLCVKVVSNYPLLASVVNSIRPPGEIVAFDANAGADAGLRELGARVVVYYFDAEELRQ